MNFPIGNKLLLLKNVMEEVYILYSKLQFTLSFMLGIHNEPVYATLQPPKHNAT